MRWTPPRSIHAARLAHAFQNRGGGGFRHAGLGQFGADDLAQVRIRFARHQHGQGQLALADIVAPAIRFTINGIELPPGHGRLNSGSRPCEQAHRIIDSRCNSCLKTARRWPFATAGEGTHDGELRLAGRVLAPTGRRFCYLGVSFLTIEASSVVEETTVADLVTLFQQLQS